METWILTGGRHVLWIPEMVDKTSDDLTPEEFLTEEEKFEYICILKRSDGNIRRAFRRIK